MPMLEEKRKTLIEAGAAPEVIEAMFEEAAPSQPEDACKPTPRVPNKII